MLGAISISRPFLNRSYRPDLEYLTDQYTNILLTNHLRIMDTQFVFVYGTLMSSYPEHALYCPKPISVAKAFMQGELFEVQGKYPILKIPEEDIALHATGNPVEDWLEANKRGRYSSIRDRDSENWIEGELLELPLQENSLAKMDEWEGFKPGGDSVYRRVVAEAITEEETVMLSWVYVTLGGTSAFQRLNTSTWSRHDS